MSKFFTFTKLEDFFYSDSITSVCLVSYVIWTGGLCLVEGNVFFPMPSYVLMNFRGFPPGCGDSIADF